MGRQFKKGLPKAPKKRTPGRPPADHRAVLNGIGYVLWTGCQWQAGHTDWFGVGSSTRHERFQTWQQRGLFDHFLRIRVKFYAKKRKVKWQWQSLDSQSGPAPLGGSQTGQNPTDRGNRGSKIHVLVDQRGAPLAVYITGANCHDKWSADDVIFSIVIPRPDPTAVEQHLCLDRGYDYEAVHPLVEQERYIAHIKHRRRRGEPPVEEGPIPGETQFPARRWVVERTFGWLAKRRSLRVRWCKQVENGQALLQLACAHLLMTIAIYG